MKPQDLFFIIILAGLLWKRNPKYLILAGLVCLVGAIPLFHFWVFFTAERLVWYATVFFLTAIIILIIKQK